MPYSIGEQGSYGCSGYPVIQDGTSEVMGCHDTAASAQNQITAINMSESEDPKKRKKLESGMPELAPASDGQSVLDPNKKDEKDIVANNNGTGIKNPEEWPESKSLSDSNGMPSATGQPYPASTKDSLFEDEEKTETGNSELVDKQAPCWDGYVQRGMKPGANGSMVPNCIPVSKQDSSIIEGDFVMAMTTEGPIVGQVEHIMYEGGTYGQPGNPYAVESTPENPAVAIRMLEEEDDGYYCYTAYSIGARMSDLKRIPMPKISLEEEEYGDEEKSLFANFGKDFTNSTRITNPFI
jgi:hypothetical protein